MRHAERYQLGFCSSQYTELQHNDKRLTQLGCDVTSVAVLYVKSTQSSISLSIRSSCNHRATLVLQLSEEETRSALEKSSNLDGELVATVALCVFVGLDRISFITDAITTQQSRQSRQGTSRF